MKSALASRAGMQYSVANSSRASTTSAATAPHASARSLIVSRSSPPWPTSTASATTSAPVCSAIQPIATDVSSPPEYASTTFSVTGAPPYCSYLLSRSRDCTVTGPHGYLTARLLPPRRLAAALSQPQQRVGEVGTAGRVTGNDQHRVVAADGAEHGRPAGVVDRGGQQL